MRETWKHFDFWLLGAVAVLTIFGITMIRSAIAGNETLADLVQRQIIFAVAGFGFLIVATAIEYRLWATIARILYVVVLAFLAVTGIAGEALGGAARWLNAGLFFIQPSELAKIVMILMLADFFARNQHRVDHLSIIARSLILTMSVVVWILIQPNLSTSIVILVIWFALLWAAGLPPRYVIIFGIIGVLLAAAAFPLLEPYQQERIITFLFPDPEARFGNKYNVTQALISIGSGGWFGQGYGHGSQVQLRFLKVRHTDFIFSALSEEFGFAGALGVLALEAFIIWRCLRAALLARDTYGALICYGVATFIAFHTLVNVAMNLNLIPVSGLPLPFVSYGGSSLLSVMLGVGLVESVILRHKTLDFKTT